MITKEIQSLQHPIVKHLVRLRENRTYREEKKRVLVIGKKMVREVAQKEKIHTLLTTETSFLEGIEAKEAIFTNADVMKKITGLAEPEGIAAEMTLPSSQDLSRKNYLLLLDKIGDPGNMGTLFRTALGLGWEGILLMEGSVDPFHERALRASMGAAFFLPFCWTSEEEALSFLQKNHFHNFLADLEGEDIKTSSFQAPLALVLGSESQGASAFAKKICQKISIPMKNQVDSLNVSAAGAILMYQMRNL